MNLQESFLVDKVKIFFIFSYIFPLSFSRNSTLTFKDSILSSLDVDNINLNTLTHSIKDYTLEIDSVEYILNMFVINQLFFSNLPQDKIDRYNRTLNLQWAIDIKNQLIQ